MLLTVIHTSGMPSNPIQSASQSYHTRPPPAGLISTTPASLRGASPATFSTQSRIARINPATPTARQQQQVRREAPAQSTHNLSFISSPRTISSNSMSSNSMFIVQPTNNPTSTTALSLPIPPPPQPPLSQSNPRVQSEGSMGRASQVSLQSSATELLEGNVNQPSSNVLPLPDNVRNCDSRDLSQFEKATNTQPPSSSSNVDVVCLSDDE